MASGGHGRGKKPRSKGKRKVAPRMIPDPATVVAEATLVSPKGNVYRVIRTTQQDPYDKTEAAPESGSHTRRRTATKRQAGPKKQRPK